MEWRHMTTEFGKGASAQPFGLALGHIPIHMTEFRGARRTEGARPYFYTKSGYFPKFSGFFIDFYACISGFYPFLGDIGHFLEARFWEEVGDG
jgi:hypothetical protein